MFFQISWCRKLLTIFKFDFIDYKSASKKKINERAKHINELISNMQMDLARYTIKKDYINHYVVKEGYVPLWVLVNGNFFF